MIDRAVRAYFVGCRHVAHFAYRHPVLFFGPVVAVVVWLWVEVAAGAKGAR